MSNEEIKRSYKESKDPENHIRVLAELNCCSVEKIKKILGLPTEKEQMILGLYKQLDELDLQIKGLEKQYKKIVDAIEIVSGVTE